MSPMLFFLFLFVYNSSDFQFTLETEGLHNLMDRVKVGQFAWYHKIIIVLNNKSAELALIQI
jgi:hypothetical protein